MDIILVGYGVSIFLGLMMGSFAGATVWRLRARQLVEDKAAGESVDRAELKRLKPLTGRSLSKDRSRCLECGHELKWYDLLPLVSWLSQGGRCRYCKKPIGRFEPVVELGTAALFVAFYHYFVSTNGLSVPFEFVLWMIALVLLVILFIYDAKWFLLPDVIMFPLIGTALILALLTVTSSADIPNAIYSSLGAVAILSGLYLALWLISRGNWVGFGDVKLGLALALLLADWKLALLALFLANLIGTLLVLPGMVTKRLSRRAHVPFGPLLISGFIIALLYGAPIVDWYVRSTTTLML